MTHDVFISYPAEERAVAEEVCERMEAQGIKCWIAPRDIKVGTSYGEAILKAIKASRGLVLVFSSHANNSTHVKKEVERAGSLGRFICTLRVEDVAPSDELEYFISSDHWLDASNPPTEGQLQQFTNDVRELLGKSVSPPTPRPRPRLPTHFTWAAAALAVLTLSTVVLLSKCREGPVAGAVNVNQAPPPSPAASVTSSPNANATPAGTAAPPPTQTPPATPATVPTPAASQSTPTPPPPPFTTTAPLLNTVWKYRQDDGVEYTYRFFKREDAYVLEFEDNRGVKSEAAWEQNGNRVDIRFKDFKGAENRYQWATISDDGKHMKGFGRELEPYEWTATRLR